MANFSFDIVSEYDKAEMNNVFDQTQREISSRYDFKGTPAEIDWLDDHKNGRGGSGCARRGSIHQPLDGQYCAGAHLGVVGTF